MNVYFLGPGSFFGELSLIFGIKSSVIVRSITNCELWVLPRTDFKQLVPYLPIKVMRQLKSNYFNILRTKDCEYHHSLVVRRPKNFVHMISKYHKYGELPEMAARLITLPEVVIGNQRGSEENIGRQGRTQIRLFHTDMRFIKVWRIFMCILALMDFFLLWWNHGTYKISSYSPSMALLDSIWPNNVNTMTHLADVPDNMSLKKMGIGFGFIGKC